MNERDPTKDERKPANAFEAHAQTVIQVVITAILLWVGNAVLNVRDSTIRLEASSAQSRDDVKDIKAELAALRTQILGATAAGLSAQVQIKELEGRVGKIEGAPRK